MNKYMGFYELKGINLPTVPWQLFTKDTVLDGGLLWTVRVAVENSDDLNLPRAVGVSAAEAVRKARELLSIYGGKGIVIYYPYFIAQKSGVMDMDCKRTVIEAVDRDLWNLVTHGRKNVTAIFPFGVTAGNSGDAESNVSGASCSKPGAPDGNGIQYFGDRSFLDSGEIGELLAYGAVMRGRFRDELSEGRSILAEWSYAYNTDIRQEPIGDRYLVFYELRGL